LQGLVDWKIMSDSWVNETVESVPAAPKPAVSKRQRSALATPALQQIVSDANELPEDSDEEEEIVEECSSAEDDGSFYQGAGVDDISESEEEDQGDEYQDAALDRRQYGILLGVAFSLYFDGAIDKLQRGMLKDLILCDDGRMLVAMEAHDWLVEHNQVNEDNQFEQLMEAMYDIAIGADDEGSTESDDDSSDENDEDGGDDDDDGSDDSRPSSDGSYEDLCDADE
jgi:hypothetical protein